MRNLAKYIAASSVPLQICIANRIFTGIYEDAVCIAQRGVVCRLYEDINVLGVTRRIHVRLHIVFHIADQTLIIFAHPGHNDRLYCRDLSGLLGLLLSFERGKVKQEPHCYIL